MIALIDAILVKQARKRPKASKRTDDGKTGCKIKLGCSVATEHEERRHHSSEKHKTHPTRILRNTALEQQIQQLSDIHHGYETVGSSQLHHQRLCQVLWRRRPRCDVYSWCKLRSSHAHSRKLTRYRPSRQLMS